MDARPVRPAAQRHRTFAGILANTLLANLTTSYLWFAITFWIYLETRNVIATGVVGGVYMLLLAVTGIGFGTLVDRYRKLAVMRWAGAATLVMFTAAWLVYLSVPERSLSALGRPWFWVLALVVLLGATVENLRNIALSTTVTLLIDPELRDRANGYVGMVQGLAFLVTSVLSGLSIGLLGLGPTLLIAVGLSALALGHLAVLRMPEETRPAATDAHGGFDLRGAWTAVAAVPGLAALVLFATFNNLIGGVYLALMDPYGLELFPVEQWGLWLALGSTGFLVGGAVVGRLGLGPRPVRTLLGGVAAMGVVGALFTIREWGWLYVLGIWLYMALVPAVEAAEQTVIQAVVPLARQGRVFGLAAAVEAAAAPVTAFMVAPAAEAWIIPFARSPAGAAALGPLLGQGSARGIALVFLIAGTVMALAAVAAWRSPAYRRISTAWAVAGPVATT
ncbi:MFS transporter [Citricoccus sp. SGAir0253]|uniref:MFS transporter n=1 Tax=Citricoccus sp. SGAir0253 TaxID=2567881 RepID=UPI0010CCC874|nr:MFS transporter [Citricoccus sp. SGAir0253]QCU77810.1 MFS transporter [Citricoccus sp. SGAir0253]